MDAEEKTISLFTTRMRQLILQYKQMKEENSALQQALNERDAKLRQIEEKLNQAQADYNSLKMAKMIEISNADMESAQKRLSKLIRDVNKCITLLTDK